jgi:hypothetical protein
VRLAALAVAADVKRHDAEILRERVNDLGLAPVGVERRGEAVDQYHRLAFADVDVTNPYAF